MADIFDEYPELKDLSFVEEYDFGECWTRNNPNLPYEALDVAAAILSTRGNYSQMGRLLNRSRRSIETYVLNDHRLRDLRIDVRASVLDAIEDGYMDDALAGDSQARRFFLSTLAKDRGYVTRNENTGKDGEPIHLQSKVDFTQVDNASLENLLSAVKKPE